MLTKYPCAKLHRDIQAIHISSDYGIWSYMCRRLRWPMIAVLWNGCVKIEHRYLRQTIGNVDVN